MIIFLQTDEVVHIIRPHAGCPAHGFHIYRQTLVNQIYPFIKTAAAIHPRQAEKVQHNRLADDSGQLLFRSTVGNSPFTEIVLRQLPFAMLNDLGFYRNNEHVLKNRFLTALFFNPVNSSIAIFL